MTPKRHRLLCCLFLLLFLPSLLRAEPPARLREPFFFGVALDGYPITEARLRHVEKEIGASPDIVSFFLQWPSATDQFFQHFPRESLDAIWKSGAVPCVTWEPMCYVNGREITVAWRKILNGTYDSYLFAFAEQAARWKKPFLLRFAHEMNIERYHWGTTKSGYGPESPGIYKSMFRYVAGVFQMKGAENVLWVFCPNAESTPNVSYDPGASWNRIEAYYPGDEVVDILGIDGYNWGRTRTKARNGWDSQWKAFSAIFGPVREKLRQLAPEKPIIIFETASVNQGGDKVLWIRNAFETAEAWRMSGLVWFQVEKENDWRINSEGKIPHGIIRKKTADAPHKWIRGLMK